MAIQESLKILIVFREDNIISTFNYKIAVEFNEIFN